MPILLAAPFSQVFFAIALLLLAWAITVLIQKPLVFLLEHVPVIGGSIASAVSDVIGNVIHWATDWAGKAVQPFVALVAVPINALLDLVSSLSALADTIQTALARVASVAAGEVGRVADRIASAVAQLGSLVNLVAAARTAIATLFDRLGTLVTVTLPGAIAAARAAILATVGHLLDALETELRAVIAGVRTWALAAIAAALTPLQAALEALRGWVSAMVAAVVNPIAAELDQLGRALGDAIGGILARLAILEKLLPLLALIPLVGIIPRVIDDFLRTKRECVDPTCSLLGDLLGGLGPVGELLSGSVLIFLVSQAIEDPDGTAQEVAGWSDELRGGASLVTQVLAGRSI